MILPPLNASYSITLQEFISFWHPNLGFPKSDLQKRLELSSGHKKLYSTSWANKDIEAQVLESDLYIENL